MIFELERRRKFSGAQNTDKIYILALTKYKLDKLIENTGNQLLPQRKKTVYMKANKTVHPKIVSDQMFISSPLIVQGHMNLQAGVIKSKTSYQTVSKHDINITIHMIFVFRIS